MVEEIDLREYIWVLRRWLWLILLCTVLAAVAAFVVSSLVEPVYEATATLLVHQAPVSGVNDYTALLTSERLARTYVKIVTGRLVLETVIDQLALQETPEDLAGRVDVELVQNTQLIHIKVEDTDPAQAAVVANVIARVFVEQIQALQRQRYAESLSSLEEQIADLSAQIEEVQQQLDEIGVPQTAQGQTELTRLETVLAGYRNTYATLVQSYEEMRLMAAQSADNVFLFEAAEVPQKPIRPRKLLNTAVAGVVGSMLAIGAAFLIEYLDDTVKTPDEVDRLTSSLSTLGTIGQISKGEGELVTVEAPLSPVSEAFWLLRTNIRYAGVDQPLRCLLVTSPMTAEGKSLVVANLAVVMAQAGLEVALVDADLRRPRQHQLFELCPRGGLAGSLLKGSTEGYLQPTGIERLALLPAGDRPPNPAELLSSHRMRDLLQELAGQIDMVLIDSPPILPVADTVGLAREVDGVLLVIQAGSTRRVALQQAVEALERVGANLIGVVINAVPVRWRRYYYGYGYEYYYGDRPDANKAKQHAARGVVE